MLNLQPPGDGPSSLGGVDLCSLVGDKHLRWLRFGRQGEITLLEALAGLDHLRRVSGYRLFFDSQYLDAAWVDPLPDSVI